MLVLLLSCTPKIEAFPEDFRFGVATAGFQVEAGCPTIAAETCEDPNSDWYQWVTDPELVDESSLFLSGDPMNQAPGHYELYEQDFDLAAEGLGVEMYRFSFEWSRLFPDGAAEQATTVDELYDYVDADALAWYHQYLTAMKAAGMEPVATVNHYTLPLWVHDGKACYEDPDGCTASGWRDEDRILPLIEMFSGFLAKEYGSDITLWMTLNEPIAVVLSGYLFPNEERTNPPGISDPEKAVQVAWNMARAHARMADALRAHDDDASVGVVINVGVVLPDEADDPEDVEAAEHMDYIYNQLILDAFLDGKMDMNLDGVVDTEDANVAGKTDWLGLNYYFGFKVAGFVNPLPGFEAYPFVDFYPIELDTDPALFAEAIDIAAARGLPLYITENGLADPLGADAVTFLDASLEVVRQGALEHDLRGYMYWSLMDNYEWNHGMGMLFGLYAVDLDTKERSLRPIGERYAAIVADHGFLVED
jgi:beta-galactosidase